MNRATRRKSIAEFRHDAARADVITYLVDADDAVIVNEPWLLRAVMHWRGNMASRRPRCAACRSGFADGAQVGGWLFASPEGASAVSVSAFCARCWTSLDDAKLERVAIKVLHAVKPGARFAP
jgi:hypothetical protein